MRMMRRFNVFGLLIFALFCISAYSQSQTEAEVTRNANLRADPSSSKKPIGRLVPPDRVELLSAEPTDGYYHVRTEEGEEGWVWGKALSILTAASIEAAGASSSASPVDSVSSDWEKPTPSKTTFNGNEGACPWNGNGFDPDQYGLKNRSDVATLYHDVNWSAVRNLGYPTAPTHRKDWSADQLAQIGPYEGVAVRVVGYVVAIKPQNGGSGEGTNCKFNQVGDVDTHIALVGKAGDPENDSVVIEFTPRFVKSHPNWTKNKLAPWLDSDKPVRVSGWLMLDPDHRNHLRKFRGTLWEIHPITKFEVYQEGQFVDLDQLP